MTPHDHDLGACDHPDGCDWPARVLFERPGRSTDTTLCHEHAASRDLAVCPVCLATVPVLTLRGVGLRQIDDHARTPWRICHGTGMVIA